MMSGRGVWHKGGTGSLASTHTVPVPRGGADSLDGVEAEVATAPVVVLLLHGEQVHLDLAKEKSARKGGTGQMVG